MQFRFVRIDLQGLFVIRHASFEFTGPNVQRAAILICVQIVRLEVDRFLKALIRFCDLVNVAQRIAEIVQCDWKTQG